MKDLGPIYEAKIQEIHVDKTNSNNPKFSSA